MSEVETKRVTPQRVDSAATLTIELPHEASASGRSSPCPTLVDGEANIPDSIKGEKDSRPSMTERTSSSSSHVRSQMSGTRKGLLLMLFAMAQFLDAFNNSALFPALPVISDTFDLNSAESQWVYSAYSLTFASFLLLSGRIADISSPKWTFVSGIAVLSLMSLIAGFAPSSIGLIVLRALQGLGAALTIPSSLTLLVWTFPEEKEQSRALAIFSAATPLANVLGLEVGALFSGYVTWKWVFWFITCIGSPIAISGALFIPKSARGEADTFKVAEEAAAAPVGEEKKVVTKGGLDFVGVTLLTVALILFVFGITSGSTAGWRTAQVWAPLALSPVLLAGFFYWETRIPEQDAALPPSLWFYPNFAVLFGLALLPFGWWVASFLAFTELWQGPYGISTIETGIRFLPMGITTGIVIMLLVIFPTPKKVKRIILVGLALVIPSTILLPFARGMENYWRLLVPAWIIGSVGNSLIIVNTQVAIFRTTPQERSGVTGAALNSALQLGTVIVTAAVTEITSSVNEKQPGDPYNGVSASFWWLLGCVVVETIAVTVMYREKKSVRQEQA